MARVDDVVDGLLSDSGAAGDDGGGKLVMRHQCDEIEPEHQGASWNVATYTGPV